MAKYSTLILLILGATTTHLSGQTPFIQTDRPGESEFPSIVPSGYIQSENGFLRERQSSTSKTIKYPSALWKYGLSKGLELSLITELVCKKDSSKNETGLKPITIGFKVNICQKKESFLKLHLLAI